MKGPRALHPAFYGCYDWHSSVHGHWMLVRLLRLFPDLPEAEEIRAVLDDHLTAENLKAEADYFARKESKPFERPYGWAWLLKLAEELHGWDDPDARRWSQNLQPLADVIVARYLEFFPKQTYPIRTGVHPNTAFGLAFAHDYARAVGDDAAEGAGRGAGAGLLRRGRRRPGAVGAGRGRLLLAEPDGGGPDAAGAAPGRVPGLVRAVPARGRPGASRSRCSTPATVTDRTDPQLVHLDGLNLSRAWCMRGIAAALPADDPARAVLADVGGPPRRGGAGARRQRRLRGRALAGLVRRLPAHDPRAGLTRGPARPH